VNATQVLWKTQSQNKNVQLDAAAGFSVGEQKAKINTGIKIECGPGPATPDRIIRVFLSRHCRRGGGDMNATASIFPEGRCIC